jgi:sugar-specific transcriptional regulator TrmB
MEVKEVLRSIGLSEREIKVYLASLKLGSSTVNQISKEAGTFRTYTYDILKSLMEKGLVSSVMKGKTQYFEASDPDRIVEILQEREDQIKEILPQLKQLKKSIAKKPTVEFFEGLAGLKLVHDTILREKPKEIRVYGNPEQHYEIMKFYLPRFVKERVKLGIRARVIIKDSKVGREWMKGKEKEELRQTRFFSEQPKEFPSVTYMWNNKIAYFTIEKKIIAVIIEDESIAEAQKVVFENMWKFSSKKPQP